MKCILYTLIITLLLLSFSPHSIAGTWEDDFSKKNNISWEIFNIAAWQNDPDENTAKWEIKNSEVFGSIHELFKNSMFLTGELTWQNYTVSCHTKFIGEEDKSAFLGLILHARIQENKRYMFLLNYFDQKASMTATAGPLKQGGEPFKGWSQKVFDFKIKFNTWYLLSASAMENDRIHFNIRNLEDGKNQAEFSLIVEEPLEDGGLTGFYVENADAVFDNIKIEGKNIPNGGTFLVESRNKLATTWSRLKRS